MNASVAALNQRGRVAVPGREMHEGIIGLYEETAAAWDKARGRDLMEAAWLRRFADLLPPRADVLDLGCGMGEPIAAWLVAQGFGVTGVDSSPSLLALAAKRLPDQQWIVGDMREVDLGRRFDGVLAWHSFFHLAPDDQRAMFLLFAAHLRAGGALMFTSGPEAGEAIGEWQGEPLYHASLAPEEYERILAANGFAVIVHKQEDQGCGGATVWLARRT
jgi:SAM-dependent methyltransferase